MPRRIAGSIWAIRITMTLSEDEEALFRIPNTVCVYHKGGMKSGGFREKPHYHIYYNCDTVKEEVQKTIRQNEIVQKYYVASNGFWSVDTKPEYTLEKYWEYVWDNHPFKGQRLLWWDIQDAQLEIPTVSPYATILEPYRGRPHHIEIVTAPKVKAAKSSLEKQQKFLKYCRDQYELINKPVTAKRTIKLLYEYCKDNGFTTETCCFVWVNYVMANLLTGEDYKISRRGFAERLENKFFS